MKARDLFVEPKRQAQTSRLSPPVLAKLSAVGWSGPPEHQSIVHGHNHADAQSTTRAVQISYSEA